MPRRLLVALSAALLLAASACTSSGSSSGSSSTTVASDGAGGGAPGTTVPKGGTLRLGVTGLDSLDPVDVVPSQSSEMMAVDLLYESLTTIDPQTQEVRPGLAAKWAPNDGLTEWTFDLRPGITFSDGKPVTAADVKFSLERVASKGAASLAGSRLDVIAGYPELVAGTANELSGVKVLNAASLTITTRVPYAPLPELLSSPLYGVVPQAVVTEKRSAFAQTPVGSGSYALAAGSVGPGGEGDATAGSPAAEVASVKLERAKGSAANLDGVELVRFADAATAYQAFVDGKVDWAVVPPDKTADAKAAYGDAQFRPFGFTRFFSFNLNNPVLADARYRQAVVQAIDRDALVKDVLHSGVPMSGVVPPSVPGGSADPCGAPCAHDPEAAKQLLAAAFPGATPPSIEIQYLVDPADPDKVLERAAAKMAQDLAAVGITATPVGKSFDEYRSFIVTGQQQLFAYGWWGIMPDPDAYLAPLLSSGAADNISGFKDPAFDDGLAAARGTKDRSERLKRYADLEHQVMGQVPLLPVAEFETDAVLVPAFNDFRTRLDGTFDVTAVWHAP